MCERDGLVPVSTAVYMVGVMCGALFVSPAADYFGRKPVMIACIALQSVFGIALVFVSNITEFSAIRFIIAALNQVKS